MARETNRQDLYAEVTNRIIGEMEEGRLPWIQPWDSALCGCAMPHNAGTGRRYSGINVLILWAAGVGGGFASQRWLTFRQAQALGGTVRKGERGTTICYADRFTPRDEEARAADEARKARQIAFLKRFTVFNIDQCDGVPEEVTAPVGLPRCEPIPQVEALLAASGADIRIGGDHAFYAPVLDTVQLPPQQAFREPVNFYRTALHELGHWTGHPRRLARDQKGAFGSAAYAKEELVAELCAAFTCASLGIHPTVRHADYIRSWLDVLRADCRAIFRAASHASKAADYLLGFAPDGEAQS